MEGYDIFEDEEYVLWLKSYHPKAIPRDLDDKGMNDDQSEQGQQDSELNRDDRSDEELDHSQQQDYPDAMYTFDPPSSLPIINDMTNSPHIPVRASTNATQSSPVTSESPTLPSITESPLAHSTPTTVAGASTEPTQSNSSPATSEFTPLT